MQDECHLLWGNVCGLVWGRRNERIGVMMTNQRERQTYYGAVNLLTRAFPLRAFPAGKGQHTVSYLEWLPRLYPRKKFLLLWDGASYHRDEQVKAYLTKTNAGLAEKERWISCLLFAPNAPEQNPVEDIWLQGKNHLRKNFAINKTFGAVKGCFETYLSSLRFNSVKFDWYMPYSRIV